MSFAQRPELGALSLGGAEAVPDPFSPHGGQLTGQLCPSGMGHAVREKWQLQPTTRSAEQALHTTPRLGVSHCSGVLVGRGSPSRSSTLGGHVAPSGAALGGDRGLQESRGCCGVSAHPAVVRGSVLPAGLTPSETRGSGSQHQHRAGSGSPAEASVANGVKSWENSLGLIAKGLTRSFGNQLMAAAT